ncbi:trypsin-like serine peptidase [Alkalihalobacillus sp. NPDC078783]
MSLTVKNTKHKELMRSVAGVLKIRQGNKKFISNASIIKGISEPLVVTAAHCVFDWYEQLYANEIVFISDSGQKYEIDKSFMSSDWTSNGIVDHDTAFLTLKKPPVNQDAFIEPIFNNKSKKNQAIIPYFRRGILRSKKREIVTGKTFEDHIHKSTLLGLKDRMGVGSSGSPWITERENKFFQFSNTSLSFQSAKDTIWGPFWGEHIESIFLNACCHEKRFENIEIHNF